MKWNCQSGRYLSSGVEASSDTNSSSSSLPASPGSAMRRICEVSSKSSSSSHQHPRAVCTALWRNRGKARNRDATTSLSVSKSTDSRRTITPVIIIRLVGCSMRSQAVSTLAMGWRCGSVTAWIPWFFLFCTAARFFHAHPGWSTVGFPRSIQRVRQPAASANRQAGLDALDVGPRHQRGREALPGRFSQPLLAVVDGTQLARQADFAKSRQLTRQRRFAKRRLDRQRHSQIRRGLAHPNAPGDVDEHVLVVDLDAAMAIHHRQQHRPGAFAGVQHARTRGRGLVAGEKNGRRVGHGFETAIGHREDTQFVGRTEAILHRPYQAKSTARVGFEIQHAVDHVFQHPVDGVLYFESDSGSRFRLIRSVKNRFGAANELGVFAMTDGGLKGVSNPSAIFLSSDEDPAAGSCVLVTREGTRPMLVEVQALVAPSSASQPRRVAVGVDPGRLAMLLAVMNRHCGIQINDQDVFVNVTGGIRVSETASDLAVALAIQSSLREAPLPRELAAFGEVGLSGELRPVYNGEERLREAAGQGFTTALVPHANVKGVKARLTIRGCRRLSDALDAAREVDS